MVDIYKLTCSMAALFIATAARLMHKYYMLEPVYGTGFIQKALIYCF